MATKTSIDWNKYLATGVKVPPGEETPVRQEIRDLSEEARYLYFKGLKRFQDVKADDPLSYFQIAGIHGKPYQTWPKGNEDIPGKNLDTKDWFGGFCTHSSILFLPWHRPYLALFESALYDHVHEVAKGIPDSDPKKQAYMTAAEKFRIPYWDWARKDAAIVPQEALDSENPLFKYRFPAGTTDDITLTGKDGSPYEATVRYPGPRNTGDNIMDKMSAFYKDPTKSKLPVLTPERNLTERTAYILFAYNTFVAMSKNSLREDEQGKAVADAANWGSLEDIHNAVHNLTGGTGTAFGGHMSSVPVSAFDPIFWLHHANIDRLFAIWQALHEDDSNPNTYVVPRQADWGTFVTPKKGKETVDSKLYPFRPDKDHWYTSPMVRLTETFGYSYPETQGYQHPLSKAEKQALLDKIGDIYVPIWKSIVESKKHIQTAGEHILPQVQLLQEIEDKGKPATAATMEAVVAQMPPADSLLKRSLEPSKPFLRDLAPNNKYLEWITNIKAEKHSLDGAYTVHVFMGEVAEPNVALWPVAPSHVGTFAPLGQPSTTECAKCRDDQGDHVQVTGQIPLTIALVERYLAGMINDLTEESVKPYLIKNLHWRVGKLDGTIVEDQSQVDHLTVYVVSNEVTLPADSSQLPYYDPDVKIYPDITTRMNGQGRGHGTGLTEGDMAV